MNRWQEPRGHALSSYGRKVRLGMTRFGEILPIYQNPASLWAIPKSLNLVFGKILYHLWEILMLLGKFPLL